MESGMCQKLVCPVQNKKGTACVTDRASGDGVRRMMARKPPGVPGQKIA